MSSSPAIEHRAERMTRWYPRAWRERYGEEFSQMLADELSDGPMALTRRGDVLAHGLLTRLAYTGLTGTSAPAPRRMRATLCALGGVLVLFVLLATGIWSQLTVGLQYSEPANRATTGGVDLMTVGVIGLGAVVAALVCGTSALAIARVLRGGASRGLLLALAVWLGAAVVLYAGCHHYAPHRPGTGGHPAAGRTPVPAGLAQISWAATLWLSAYWVHPGALGAFPAAEIAWMAASPLAWLALALASAAILRRLDLGPVRTRWAVWTCRAGLSLMLVFLTGAMTWLLARDAGPGRLFNAGAVDVVVVVLLAVGLVSATHLTRRAAVTSAAETRPS